MLSDDVVTIRPSTPQDVAALIAGRDALCLRFLGEEDPEPTPTSCTTVAGDVVGWVDFDHARSWLEADEVNIGYSLFPAYRGKGYATRAVRLLLRHISETTAWRTATLLIDSENERRWLSPEAFPACRMVTLTDIRTGRSP